MGAAAKCSALHYLRYTVRAETDYTASYFLTGTILHEGMEAYYKGEVATPQEGVEKAIRELFEKYEVSWAYDHALELAKKESEILKRFESGEFKKPTGEMYSAPRMTKIYKELAKEAKLDKLSAELNDIVLGKVRMPDGGAAEFVQRIQHLINKYARTIMVPRNDFSRVCVEGKFDIIEVTPRGREVRLLGYMDLVGATNRGTYALLDYKSGRAKDVGEHQKAADTSLQLTVYEHVLVDRWRIPREDLMVGLHFMDAGYEASTRRTPEDFKTFLGIVDTYMDITTAPVLVKRHFYDDQGCQGCEYRSACINTFGESACSSRKSAPLAAPAAEDQDDIWK